MAASTCSRRERTPEQRERTRLLRHLRYLRDREKLPRKRRRIGKETQRRRADAPIPPETIEDGARALMAAMFRQVLAGLRKGDWREWDFIHDEPFFERYCHFGNWDVDPQVLREGLLAEWSPTLAREEWYRNHRSQKARERAKIWARVRPSANAQADGNGEH